MYVSVEGYFRHQGALEFLSFHDPLLNSSCRPINPVVSVCYAHIVRWCSALMEDVYRTINSAFVLEPGQRSLNPQHTHDTITCSPATPSLSLPPPPPPLSLSQMIVEGHPQVLGIRDTESVEVRGREGGREGGLVNSPCSSSLT